MKNSDFIGTKKGDSVLEVIMPKLGVTMEEGRIIRWFKKEGDYINEEEVLFELETDKVTQEVESPVAGYLKKIIINEQDDDETVPVNTVVAIIEE